VRLPQAGAFSGSRTQRSGSEMGESANDTSHIVKFALDRSDHRVELLGGPPYDDVRIDLLVDLHRSMTRSCVVGNARSSTRPLIRVR
jgi:hypothetical protein